MNKVFLVSLYNGKEHDYIAELQLPATPYELLDALARVRFQEGDHITCDVEDYGQFNFLDPVMDDSLNLFELNALAHRIALLDEEGQAAFEGLVLMEQKKAGTCSVGRLVDLAHSSECCDVHLGISSYEELGHFYVDNDMVHGLENATEEVLRFVDFERIGRVLSEGEGGVLTSKGYVIQTEEVKSEFQTMDLDLRRPDYTILLELEREGNSVQLQLPASLQEVENALKGLGADTWSDPLLHIQCVDCAAPVLNPILGGMDSVTELDRLSSMLQQMNSKALTKYKAVLEAVGDWSLQGAIHIAEHLDDYLLMENYVTSEDMARDFISCDGHSEMLPFVNLAGYGNYLMKSQHGVMGDYGMVMRSDCQPLQSLQPQTPQEEIIMG